MERGDVGFDPAPTRRTNMTNEAKTILGVFAHPDDESMGPAGRWRSTPQRDTGWLLSPPPTGGREALRGTAGDTANFARPAAVKPSRRQGFSARVPRFSWTGRWKTRSEHPRHRSGNHPNHQTGKTGCAHNISRVGISYHPDHRVVALALKGAYLGAGRRGWYSDAAVEALPPHAPSRLYYYTVRRSLIEKVAWPRNVYASTDDEITTLVDTAAFADVRWRAIQAHESQKDGPPFRILYEAGMFNEECFVRVFPSCAPESPGNRPDRRPAGGLTFDLDAAGRPRKPTRRA